MPRPATGRRLAWRAAVAGLSVAAAACLAVALVATGQARDELNRGPTPAERSAAAAQALTLRWRTLSAGQIFPARLGYRLAGLPAQTALRVGIAVTDGCAAGLDPVAARAAARHGCQAVLRATYTDQLRGIVWTVGVVAFRGPAQAASFIRTLAGSRPLTSPAPGQPPTAAQPQTAQPQTSQPQTGQASQAPGRLAESKRPAPVAVLHGYLRTLPPARTPVGALVIRGRTGGVRALAIPRSVAALFGDRARQLVTGWQQGPYAVLATAGYADGRPARAGLEQRPAIFRPATQFAAGILAPLVIPVPVRCQSPGWQC